MMNNTEKTKIESVPSSIYTAEYYKTCCDGFDEFNQSHGKELPRRILEPLKLLDIAPDSVILDVGCGRGELIYHLAQQGHFAVGLDYAEQGVKIARDALLDREESTSDLHIGLSQANARYLSFPTSSIDHVFMLDVVEHLYAEELHQVFLEIFRVLKPGGKLIIHTMPNTWYYAVGYPFYRLLQRLRGDKLPANPRDRWDFSDVHVNEQNPFRLLQALKKAQFETNVWLTSIQDYSYEKNKIVKIGMRFLTSIYPFKWFFCNDIFAIAVKPTR